MNRDNFNIEDWLDGRLNGQETQLFEQELAENAQLRAEVEAVRNLRDRLADAAISQKIAQAAARRGRAKAWANWRLGLTTALLFLLTGFWFWQKAKSRPPKPMPNEQPTTRPQAPADQAPEAPENAAAKNDTRPPVAEKNTPKSTNAPDRLALVRQFYDPPVAFSNVRAEAPSDDLEHLKQLFSEKKYAEALAQLPRAQVDTKSPKIRFFKAHCLLANGQFQAAADNFRSLETDPATIVYRDAAQWYGILSNLGLGQTGDPERARLTKSILDDAEHAFRAEVLALEKAKF